MPLTRLWAGMRTWSRLDAETDEATVLIIHDNGRDDLLHHTFSESKQSGLKKGRSNLYEVEPMPASPIDIFKGQGSLQPSSIRVGIRGDEAWHPEDFFVFGEDNGRPVPLALARTITKKLSTDRGDDLNDPFGARISIPIPPARVGTSTTAIVGLIVLMRTGADGTRGPVELRITTKAPDTDLVVEFDMPTSAVSSSAPDSAQRNQIHQKRNAVTFYYVEENDVVKPFKKADLDESSITLRDQGDESWLPASFFIFGIGRQRTVSATLVPLVHMPDWSLGTLEAGGLMHLPLAPDPPP